MLNPPTTFATHDWPTVLACEPDETLQRIASDRTATAARRAGARTELAQRHPEDAWWLEPSMFEALLTAVQVSAEQHTPDRIDGTCLRGFGQVLAIDPSGEAVHRCQCDRPEGHTGIHTCRCSEFTTRTLAERAAAEMARHDAHPCVETPDHPVSTPAAELWLDASAGTAS
jgi:hypothetical protein